MEIADIKTGEIRVGIIEKRSNDYFVDVGLEFPIKYDGKFKQGGRKVNVKLVKNKNSINAIDIEKSEIAEKYWGYNVLPIKDLKRQFEQVLTCLPY